jgi:hypothetical protein
MNWILTRMKEPSSWAAAGVIVIGIGAVIEDREKFDELNKELGRKLDAANVYKDVLIDKLRRHDLAKLSLKKPGLVESRINNASKKLFRSLEAISGAAPPAPVPAK